MLMQAGDWRTCPLPWNTSVPYIAEAIEGGRRLMADPSTKMNIDSEGSQIYGRESWSN